MLLRVFLLGQGGASPVAIHWSGFGSSPSPRQLSFASFILFISGLYQLLLYLLWPKMNLILLNKEELGIQGDVVCAVLRGRAHTHCRDVLRISVRLCSSVCPSLSCLVVVLLGISRSSFSHVPIGSVWSLSPGLWLFHWFPPFPFVFAPLPLIVFFCLYSSLLASCLSQQQFGSLAFVTSTVDSVARTADTVAALLRTVLLYILE